VAGDALIDAYLAELDGRLGRLPDRSLVIEEIADHLWEKVDRLVATGRHPVEAQRDALSEFGAPDLVGRAFASAAHGGAAVPTKVSNGFGWVAAVGGVMWFLGGLVTAFVPLGSGGDAEWWIFFTSLMAGFVGVLMLGAGVHNRSGSPALGWLALALLAAPFGLMAFQGELWWFLSVSIIGVAILVFALGARPLAWLLVALVLLDALAVFEAVSDFDQNAAFEVAAGIAILSSGAALFFAGRWLATETPVDQPDDLATA
jgi:hypothetical protein